MSENALLLASAPEAFYKSRTIKKSVGKPIFPTEVLPLGNAGPVNLSPFAWFDVSPWAGCTDNEKVLMTVTGQRRAAQVCLKSTKSAISKNYSCMSQPGSIYTSTDNTIKPRKS